MLHLDNCKYKEEIQKNTKKYKKYKEIQSAYKKPEANFIVSQQGTLTTVAKYKEEIQGDKTEI